MSSTANPGTDVLRLLRPWLAGARLAAGQCLLSRTRPVLRLVAEACPVEGCGCLVCAPSVGDLAARHVAHRVRAHEGVR